jgi:diguanylate cyclase (GGDEF)-like protein
MRSGFVLRSRHVLHAGLAVLAALCCLCVPMTAQADNGLVPVRIQLKWFHQFQFAGYYAALDQGYFRDAGLDVTLIEGGPDINPTEAVLNGDADFGIGTSGLLVSRSRGRPVVAVAAIFQHSPYILIARNTPEINDVRDLVGRQVMVEPYAEELIAYLAYEGVRYNDIIVMPHSGNPLDLRDSDVAAMTAYTTTEPFILERAGIPYRRFDPKVAGIDFYGDTLFTTDAYVARHEDVVTAVRDAVVEGWRYALHHQDEVIALIHDEYGSELSLEHERHAADEIRRLLIPDLIDIGYLNPTRWQHIADEFAAAGLLEQPVDLDSFLFSPTVRADRSWLYAALAAAIVLIALTSAALAKFYRLNLSLRAEIRVRRALEHELKKLAVTDPGTGVFNRRGFLEALGTALGGERTGARAALLILDVDNFKDVNDTHGHAAGDRVLQEFSALCARAVREGDILGRLGGEEFALVLKDTGTEGARDMAERIRRMTQSHVIRLDRGDEIRVTVSIGFAVHQPGEALDALMSRADGAMYEAKCLGRNRVVEAAETNQTARLNLQRVRAHRQSVNN